MEEQVKILCVDDEKNVLRSLQRLFLDDDYEIMTAESAVDGLEILHGHEDIQLVVSDFRMPGMNGIDFLREVCRTWPDTVRIVLSGYADTAAVVEAINDGQIYKFIPKPWNDDELRVTIQNAIEQYFLKKKNLQLMDELKASNDKLRKINEYLESTVEKAVKSALRQESQSICGSVFGCLPMGIIGIDDDGRIFYFNDRARILLGGLEDNILGRPWPAVLPKAIHPLMEKLIAQGGLTELCLIGGQSGWSKGSRIQLENLQGLVLAFDWGKELYD